MKLKEITPEELGMATEKVLTAAEKSPVVIRSHNGKKTTFILQKIDEQDLEDALLLANPRFQASIRKSRRQFAQGKGISLEAVRTQLSTR